MNRLGEILAANGPMLLIGATAWLSCGNLVVRLLRSPVRRQRAAEMTLLCLLVWAVLACLPLPRWTPQPPSHPTPAAVSVAGGSTYPDAASPADWEPALESVSRTFAETVPPPAGPPVVIRENVAPTEVVSEAKALEIPRKPLRAFESDFAEQIALIYLFCAAGCAAWLLLGHVMLWRLVRRASQPAPWLLELFEAVCLEVGLQQKARLLVVRAGVRPASCGLIRPTVLLGEEDCCPAKRGRLRQILLHEAAHLWQRDAWGNALFNLAMPLLWLHPFYWLLWSQTSLARELVADDVAAACGGRTAYANDLLDLAWLRLGHRAAPAAALGIFRSPSHLYRRLHMLVHRDTRLESRCPSAWKFASGTAFALALMAATATFGVRRAAAADSDAPAAAQPTAASLAGAAPSAATPPPTLTPATEAAPVATTPAPAPAIASTRSADPTSGSSDQADDVARLQKALDAARHDVDELNRQLAKRNARGTEPARPTRNASRRASLGHITFDYRGEGSSGTILAYDTPTNKLMWKLNAPMNRDSTIQCYDNETLLIKSADGYARLVSAEDGQVIRAWAPGVEAPTTNERSVNPFEGAAAPIALPASPAAEATSAPVPLPAPSAAPAPEPMPAPAAIPSRAPSPAPSPSPAPPAPTNAPAPSAAPALLTPRPAPAPALAPTPVPAATTVLPTPATSDGDGASPNTTVSSLRPQLDLVALADRYADAVAAAAAAKEELSNASDDPRERSAIKAKLIAADQKAKLFRSIAQAALAQAEKEHATALARYEQGMATASGAVESEGRIKILSLILNAGGGDGEKPATEPRR